MNHPTDETVKSTLADVIGDDAKWSSKGSKQPYREVHPQINTLMAWTAKATDVLMAGAHAQSLKGAASAIPAYYDHDLFTIQFVEFSPTAEQALLQHNQSLNFIYQSDPGLPGGEPFISVIDAIPGDGFNPIWEEVQITFTAGNTPRQLFSDDEIAAAAAAGEITLDPTGEVYWCPVVGQKPKG